MRSAAVFVLLALAASADAFHCTQPPSTLPPFNISVLDKAAWRVVAGHNRAFDCYPCMHLIFDAGVYNFSYYVPAQGAYELIQCTISQSEQKGIIVKYHTHGTYGEDHWYILASQQGYIFVYYCGELDGVHYEGATIIHKTGAPMPAAVEATMATAAKGVNLDLSTFCRVNNTGCTN